MLKKLPPAEKIPEAWSAIADGRVELSVGQARVWSSDRAKRYTVRWAGTAYASDDNATYWQGYPGYPVIAVLMEQGLLRRDGCYRRFAGINWHELNKRHRRDYAAALADAMRGWPDAEAVNSAIQAVYRELASLDIDIRRRL